MLDTKSDYSLNKSDTDAIVCRSADGVHIRLTRENLTVKKNFRNGKTDLIRITMPRKKRDTFSVIIPCLWMACLKSPSPSSRWRKC